jgi:protein SCO1/2
MTRTAARGAVIAGVLFAAVPGLAAGAGDPPALQRAALASATGRWIPRELPLRTSGGGATTLGAQLDGRSPVVLTMAYLRCPMLCGLITRGLADGLRRAQLDVGRDVQAITISFDPADTPAAARAAAAGLCQAVDADPCRWRVLLASAPAAHRLAATLGFQYAFDKDSGTWAHPAVVYVISPDGQVTGQLTGVSFAPAALRAAVQRASAGEASAGLVPALVRCFAYVPALRRHAASIAAFKRIGWLLTLAVGAVGIAALSRRVRRRTR